MIIIEGYPVEKFWIHVYFNYEFTQVESRF